MLPVIFRRIVLIVASLVFLPLEGIFPVDVFGQHDPLVTRAVPFHDSFITRTIHRTPDTHRRGFRALSPDNLARMGGVLSQADSLIDLSGNPVSVRVELAADQPYPGYIEVHRTGFPTPHRYPIEYNDLVPMVLFVDSGGTSLYTFWESDSGRFPPNFERDAGFVNHRHKGLIALEFQGTRYSDAVHLLDTCHWVCAESADDDLDSVVERINIELGRLRYDNIDPRVVGYITYINTDVDLPFRVSVDDNRFSVDGNIARLYPSIPDNRIVIDNAMRILTSEHLLYLADLAEAVEVREVVAFWLSMDGVASVIALEFSMLGRLVDVHFLFETLALLRAAKESSPDGWESFRQALESEVLVNANPEPWDRYSRSFCSLYSEDDDCQN